MSTSDKYREGLERLIDKIDWAYNDACFTAPEDTERMNRQWRVMSQAVTDARELLQAEGAASIPLRGARE